MSTDWNDLQWRIGHFWLSRQQIVENPDAAFSLFGKMIVLRCEHHFASDHFEYIAISPLFEQMVNYTKPPNYELIFNKDTGETVVRREMQPLDDYSTSKILVTALMTNGERGYVLDLADRVRVGVGEKEATNFSSFQDATNFIRRWGLREGNVVAT